MDTEVCSQMEVHVVDQMWGRVKEMHNPSKSLAASNWNVKCALERISRFETRDRKRVHVS
jgi:hypothetical protein